MDLANMKIADIHPYEKNLRFKDDFKDVKSLPDALPNMVAGLCGAFVGVTVKNM